MLSREEPDWLIIALEASFFISLGLNNPKENSNVLQLMTQQKRKTESSVYDYGVHFKPWIF
jgi:hypothetical protein